MSKFYFECVNCGEIILPDKINYLCAACSSENTQDLPPKGVLKTVYNYNKIKEQYLGNLFDSLLNNSFFDLLPIKNKNNFPLLKVGNTPLYKVENFNNKKLHYNLFLKDDSQNPTFSFKDRASYLVSTYAKENNIDTIVAASTGNAGSSLAGICAAQNQKAIIFVPASAPKAKLTQIIMYGATIIPVEGTYDDAFDLSIAATKKYGWYNRNTAFNPFTIEGKKTVSFEIFNQLNKVLPDNIFVPVGDGVIISGVYKGFEDLLNLGIINKIPKIIAVQADGSSNIINNLNKKKFTSNHSKTIADSISVDIPRNFYMTKDFLNKYNGESISVTDNEILAASKSLSKNIGIFTEPASAASFAGLLKYYEQNKIENNSNNIVLLTGSGLKDLNSVQNIINIPKSVKPDLKEVEKFLKM
ncbi:MAG: threonine synthase [Bacteroidales bacterium]|nr:threonine synthase [Bacteroidales bacterium]